MAEETRREQLAYSKGSWQDRRKSKKGLDRRRSGDLGGKRCQQMVTTSQRIRRNLDMRARLGLSCCLDKLNQPNMKLVEARAGMVELADTLALGASGRKAVQVQVLFPAPTQVRV